MRESVVYRFPSSSNIRYLPLVYFLPRELIGKCPTLNSLPRNLSILSASKPLIGLIESEAFLNEIMDAAAALAFPHFGFGGWKENYTGDFPVWKLSYALPLWAKGIECETGWGLQALFNTPAGTEIPFFSSEYVHAVFELVVKQTIIEQEWQPLLDTLRQMPCEEDFEKWNSNVRKAFVRRWYHTRSKKVQSLSLEACLEDGYGGLRFIPDSSQDVEEVVASQDYVDRFMATLSQRDADILRLRMDGFTHVMIAKHLGYANHSGVVKRMKYITKKFEIYQQTQQETLLGAGEASRIPGS